MNFLNAHQVGLAARDLVDGTRNWRTWYVLGLSEVRQRYRRSVFGPFWVTLSMGVQALIMGFVLSFLFKSDIERYIPFLCISLVTWTFLSTVVIEGSTCFIAMSAVILQIKRPLWIYIMLTLWRSCIIYAHTVVIFVAAALVYGVRPSTAYLLIPAGLALLVINSGWMALAAGLLSARFRDVPMLIQNAFTMLVWLTPVYYQIDQLGSRVRLMIELNPLTYVVNVARGPFLNEIPPLQAWLIVIAIAVCGWAFAFVLFVRSRARVAYWL